MASCSGLYLGTTCPTETDRAPVAASGRRACPFADGLLVALPVSTGIWMLLAILVALAL